MKLSNYGFTKNWRESFWRYYVNHTKRIKLAVVGANSHGKSYLLFDLVHAFEQLGFTSEDLPLSFPYSSLTGYVQGIRNEDGCVRGTSRYACRHENHYGAVLRSKELGVTLDIEFVNIPGEAFKAGMSSVAAFGDLKRALERTGEIFTVTTWRSQSGNEQYIVELSDEARKELHISAPNYSPTGDPVEEKAYRGEYQEVEDIFRRLHKRTMSPDISSRRKISGRKLIKNFFMYQPDSMMMAIRDGWQSLTDNKVPLTGSEFLTSQFAKDFYFYMYCLDATDIVMCDKLFYPENGAASEAERAGANGFVDFARQLDNFLVGKYNQKHHPNIYLAFRGADRLLDEAETMALAQQLKHLDPYNLNNAIYSVFLHGLLRKLDADKVYNISPEELKDWLGTVTDPKKLTLNILRDDATLRTLTDMPLRNHIQSRLGSLTGGFWRLLMSVGQSDEVQTLYNNKSFPLPPHVYFTSTPIDSNYHIYQCDGSKDNQRFVREDPETHKVEALNVVGHYLSFGATQLCIDMLLQNGAPADTLCAGGLLSQCFQSVK